MVDIKNILGMWLKGELNEYEVEKEGGKFYYYLNRRDKIQLKIGETFQHLTGTYLIVAIAYWGDYMALGLRKETTDATKHEPEGEKS